MFTSQAAAYYFYFSEILLKQQSFSYLHVYVLESFVCARVCVSVDKVHVHGNKVPKKGANKETKFNVLLCLN